MSRFVRRNLKRLGLGAVLVALLCVAVPVVWAQDQLDLSKALKIGSGKTMVIEFTDPDCPFCRKAEAYFQGKAAQVTRYIFFIPLPSHPDSKAKIQYILSARDKERAYLEVIAGVVTKAKLKEITPEGVRLQKEHEEIARMNKMTSTPTFMIYGRIVEGFDLKKLGPLLQ